MSHIKEVHILCGEEPDFEQHKKIVTLYRSLRLGSLRSIATRSQTSMTSVRRFIEGMPMRMGTYDKIYSSIIEMTVEMKEKQKKRSEQLNRLLES